MMKDMSSVRAKLEALARRKKKKGYTQKGGGKRAETITDGKMVKSSKP